MEVGNVQSVYLLACLAFCFWIDSGDVKQVGLVLDAGIEEDLQLRHLQVADAARASLGLPVLEYAVTDTPLEVPFYCLFVCFFWLAEKGHGLFLGLFNFCSFN